MTNGCYLSFFPKIDGCYSTRSTRSNDTPVLSISFKVLWAYCGLISLQPTFITYLVIIHSDTTTEITSLDQIQGDWWILKGQNCGQDELWNGGYDAYPCQLESYVQVKR